MSDRKSTRLARVLLLAVNCFYLIALFGGGELLIVTLVHLSGLALPTGDTPLSISAHYETPPDFQWESAAGSGVVALRGHEWTSLLIQNPRWQVAGGVADFIFLVMLVLVAHQLRAFLRSVTAGDPFIPANPRRIRNIGVLIIAADLFSTGWTWLLSCFIAPHLSLDGVLFTARFDLNWTQLLLGFLILLIAQIFELGVQLQEEQALTV